MTDRRFVGSAIRRRMGEPSSHLGMAESVKPSPDVANARDELDQALQQVDTGSPATDNDVLQQGEF